MADETDASTHDVTTQDMEHAARVAESLLAGQLTGETTTAEKVAAVEWSKVQAGLAEAAPDFEHERKWTDERLKHTSEALDQVKQLIYLLSESPRYRDANRITHLQMLLSKATLVPADMASFPDLSAAQTELGRAVEAAQVAIADVMAEQSPPEQAGEDYANARFPSEAQDIHLVRTALDLTEPKNTFHKSRIVQASIADEIPRLTSSTSPDDLNEIVRRLQIIERSLQNRLSQLENLLKLPRAAQSAEN